MRQRLCTKMAVTCDERHAGGVFVFSSIFQAALPGEGLLSACYSLPAFAPVKTVLSCFRGVAICSAGLHLDVLLLLPRTNSLLIVHISQPSTQRSNACTCTAC